MDTIVNNASKHTLKRLIKKYKILASNAKDTYLKEHYKEMTTDFQTTLEAKL